MARKDVARPRGFEPLTSASGGQRSVRLSYGRIGYDEGADSSSLTDTWPVRVTPADPGR